MEGFGVVQIELEFVARAPWPLIHFQAVNCCQLREEWDTGESVLEFLTAGELGAGDKAWCSPILQIICSVKVALLDQVPIGINRGCFACLHLLVDSILPLHHDEAHGSGQILAHYDLQPIDPDVWTAWSATGE